MANFAKSRGSIFIPHTLAPVVSFLLPKLGDGHHICTDTHPQLKGPSALPRAFSLLFSIRLSFPTEAVQRAYFLFCKNVPNIPFTTLSVHFSCTHSRCCGASQPSISRTFSFPKWNSTLIKQHLPTPSPSPWQPPFYFLSLWIRILWVPHVSGIIWHLSFCDWLTSISIMPSRFIHTVACVRISFFFKAE